RDLARRPERANQGSAKSLESDRQGEQGRHTIARWRHDRFRARGRRGGAVTMLQLIIQGGEVVRPQGVAKCDLARAGEKIAAIAAPGRRPAQAVERVIDAKDRIVRPGGIDPHVHLKPPWMNPDGTPLITAGPEQVGRAALHGGTTTLIDFAYWRQG